jgi:diguanylate cyclase (GGDEF)-like protein
MDLIETDSNGALDGSHETMASRQEGTTARLGGTTRWVPAVEAERDALAARLMAAERVIADQHARLAVLETLAATDELTGLNNRRGFLADLKKQLARARRNPAARGVLMLADIDGFKQINDRLGHLAGDSYLRRVAALLTGCVRETDSVARLGGDEFAVLLTDTDEANGRRRAAEIARRLNEASSGRGAARVNIRLSFGVEPYRAGDNATESIDRADQALYRDKADRHESHPRLHDAQQAIAASAL